MQTVLPLQGRSVSPEIAPFLKVLIIYDDVWSGSHAVHVLTTLDERLGSHVSLRPDLWPFSCLDDEDRFNLALAEAIEADIVLVAAGEEFRPSARFKEWLKRCVDRKRGTDSAIVLLLDGQPADSLELAGAKFVRRTALDAGLDFISSKTPQVEAVDQGTQNRQESLFSTTDKPKTGSSPSNRVGPRRDSNLLYVEDDPLQRRVCAIVLVRAGYTVTTAASAFEAWEELNSAAFDLLITDNEMPEFTGLELVAKARASGIKLPIIIASGSAELLENPEYDWLKFSARIQKPFDAHQLLAAVQDVLESAKKPSVTERDTAFAHRLIQECRSIKPHADWGINE